MKYRVEVVQTTVLYIEADSSEEAQDIATGDYIWNEDQTAHKALLAHGIDSLPLSVYCSEPIQRSALVLGFSGVPRKAMPRLTKKLGEKLRSLH